MSRAYLLSQLPKEKAKLLAKHLSVSPEEPDISYFQAQASGIQRHSKKVVIEAFDAIEENKDVRLYVPFSYAYHFLPESSISIPSQPKLHFSFEGTLLPRQKEIREEIFETLNRSKSIVLCLHTGFGKTIFSLYLASKIGLRTMVLCHRTIIIDQWLASVKKYLPKATVEVWNSKRKSKTLPDIMIANVLNITKWSREFYSSFGLVLCDEVHTMCTEQFIKSLLWFTPQYIIGLSATPFRNDGMDKLIELYMGPEVISRKLQKIFNYYRLKTRFVPEVERTLDGGINWNSVLESQANSYERNKLICDLARIFSLRNILILVKRIDHANTLHSMLRLCGEDADVFLGSTKEVNYNCRILIATYSKGGVGFDHSKLDMLIVGADVEESFLQYLGRVFRRDDVIPIVVDLIDNLSIMTKHAATRKTVCEECGGTVHKFEKAFKDFEMYRSFLY
jgi:superfamily II DNA or RNA helicase